MAQANSQVLANGLASGSSSLASGLNQSATTAQNANEQQSSYAAAHLHPAGTTGFGVSTPSRTVTSPYSSNLTPYGQSTVSSSSTQAPVFAGHPSFFQHPTPPTPTAGPSSGVDGAGSPTNAGVKRKLGADEEERNTTPNKTVRKRRVRVIGEDGKEEAGGAKHWTDEEKGKLFTWMLGSDEHWETFANQMNTVFRDASMHLFGSKKSFTALKSCYHRNVETFKQVLAFEMFLARSAPASNPPPDPNDIIHAPIPPSFPSSLHRSNFLERKLEAARSVANIPVGNLNLKVIDHWYRLGWIALFKSRYRPDPETGIPIAYHGPPINSVPTPAEIHPHLFPQPSPAALQLLQASYAPVTGIDPSLMQQSAGGDTADGEAEEDSEDEDAEHEQENEVEQTLSPRDATPSINPSPNPFPPVSSIALSTSTPGYRKGTGGGRTRRNSQGQAQTSVATQSPPQIQPQQQPTPHVYAPPPIPGPSQMPHMHPGIPPYTYPPIAMYPPPPPHTHTPHQPNAHTPGSSYPTPPLPPPQHLPPQSQTEVQLTQALMQLSTLTQSLVNTCAALTDVLKVQVEEGKVRLELMKRREERERRREERELQERVGAGSEKEKDKEKEKEQGMDKKEKATLATEVLANAGVDEQVKQAAAEYLKRLFAFDV